jgi:hypothetical protein
MSSYVPTVYKTMFSLFSGSSSQSFRDSLIQKDELEKLHKELFEVKYAMENLQTLNLGKQFFNNYKVLHLIKIT